MPNVKALSTEINSPRKELKDLSTSAAGIYYFYYSCSAEGAFKAKENHLLLNSWE